MTGVQTCALPIYMTEESFIEVDGEVVQRDGAFRFEDDFEE